MAEKAKFIEREFEEGTEPKVGPNTVVIVDNIPRRLKKVTKTRKKPEESGKKVFKLFYGEMI